MSEHNTASSSPTTPRQDKQCQSCVELLQHVLLGSKDSRPHALLQSMTGGSGLRWQASEDGLAVEIPAERQPMPVRRRWSRLHPPEEVLPTTTVLPQVASPPTAQLATSASAQAPVAPKTEWMQLSCKPCANVGPEGGARAFVMGPTPLSIVVCSNRLQRTNSRAAQIAEMQEILTHELVHVYDVRELQLDLRDCENLAYSEVRAAREAECASAWYPYQRTCVRSKALTATNNLFASADACLRKVFDAAMNDTRPFDRQQHKGASATASRSSSR